MKRHITRILMISLSIITLISGFSSDVVIAAGNSDIRPLARYTNTDGEYIDNSWSAASLPWNWQMTGDEYNVKVKEDFTAGQIIEYSSKGSAVYFQPMSLEYTNDLGQIQPVAMPYDVTPIVGEEETELTVNVTNDQGYILWEDGYGSGIDFKWQCAPGTLEKRLIVDDLSSLPAPQPFMIAGGNVSLRLNLIFDPDDNLDIIVNGETWDKSTKVQTFDFIQFQYNGETIFFFKPLQYWSDNPIQDGESIATLTKSGNSLYISILVPYSWLQSAVYPVYIDADVTIDDSVYTGADSAMMRTGVFWISTSVGYLIYLDGDESLVYQKSSNGGSNWGGAVTIDNTNTDIQWVDCWADWQTAGDSGTVIHMAYISEDNNYILYNSLDTNDDSLSGADIIYDATTEGISGVQGFLTSGMSSICKTRGGNICVDYRFQDDATNSVFGFATSPDGDTWTDEAICGDGDSLYDYFQLYAGNEADTNDIWAVYWDAATDQIRLLTYDDSGDSWSSQLIAGSILETQNQFQMDGQINVNNGHLYFAIWNLYNNAASDLLFFDINGASSITQKTNIITDTAEYATCSVFIDQTNSDIYVAYLGGTDFTSLVKCYYQKSTDGGANWSGSDQSMQADAEDNEKWVSSGCIKSAWGGKFMPIWFNDDLNDIFCNTDNAVTVNAAAGGAAPDVTTGTNTTISCNSFNMWGIITDNHTGTTTTVGMYYGIGGFTANVSQAYSTDNFTVTISGLADNTEYMVKAFAINEYGTGNGTSVNVTTLASSNPTFTTQAATNIGSSTARLNGTISGLDCDDSDDVFWQWGTSSGNYTANYTDTTDRGNGAVYHDLTALTANTTYYFRGCAHLAGGAYQCGGELSFTTLNVTAICLSPTSLVLSILPGDQIYAEWDTVENITDYLLLVSTIDYPDDPEDQYGYAVAYSGTATSATLEGYETDITEYFFSLWTHCNPYSDEYVTASIGGAGLEDLTLSFQNIGGVLIGMVPLIAFSVISFWKENSIMFGLTSGVSIAEGFYCYNIDSSPFMFGISLVLWVYAIICLGFGLMCMFKRRPTD